MTKPRIKFIMNPTADNGNAWRYSGDLRHMFEGVATADWAGTVYPGHAQELAVQAAKDKYDYVIGLGGDGTAHEVINGLMQIPADERPVFGIIPLGSGNDFAANIGMPADVNDIVRVILDGHTRQVDLALIEDDLGRKEYLDNTANIGVGGSVTIFSREMEFWRGYPMYIIAVLKTIFSNYIVMKTKITTETEEWEQESVMIALNNGPREGGGFITGPGAKLDDGMLNYCIVDKVSRLKMLIMMSAFMQGTQEKYKDVRMGQFKTMEIQSQAPLFLHTDGEIFAGLNHDIHYLKISVLPAHLTVIAPKEG